jgi:hypothetical protein
VGKVHLLPGLRELNGINPLIVSWVSDVIKMVVDTGVALSADLTRDWEALDIATVVVAPKYRYVVGKFHAFLIVTSNFLDEDVIK